MSSVQAFQFLPGWLCVPKHFHLPQSCPLAPGCRQYYCYHYHHHHLLSLLLLLLLLLLLQATAGRTSTQLKCWPGGTWLSCTATSASFSNPTKLQALCSTCTPAFLLFRWASILRFANAAHCLCVERHIFQSHVAYSAIWSCYQHTGQTICYIAIHCIGKDVRSSLQPSLLVCLLRVHCMDLYDYSHSLCLLIVCSIKW